MVPTGGRLTPAQALKPQCFKFLTSAIPVSLQGVVPNLFKLAPAAGISWFTFEEVKRLLGVDVRS